MKGLIASMFTLSLFSPLRSSLHTALRSIRLGVRAFAGVGFGAAVSALLLAAPSALAEQVEITLVDQLDGQKNSYCIDIVGGGRNVDPANGLQSHTCYSYRGALGRDQAFEADDFAGGILSMPQMDVCVVAAAPVAGSVMTLDTCDADAAAQRFAITLPGTIEPVAAPGLCMTVAAETRLGNNPIHQIKALSLQPCSADLAAFQTWRARSEDD